ncbi:MAG: DUF72 domain-containing protein [Candidatus Omnitrophica bacterium]|nr:DUF72 domain-containing protein [Candidatus Omnitrophota bacterium]
MKLYIGTSGYQYPHWGNGVFYHKDLKQDQWLEFYGRQFNAVELSGTFHQLPDTGMANTWLRATPREFQFAVQGSRFITHVKQLKDTGEALATLAENLRLLKPKTACFFWQLPEGFKKDRELLTGFCQQLKKTQLFRDVRHVFDFKDPSWLCDDIYKALRDFRCCLCLNDSASSSSGGGHSAEWVTTTDFIYLRCHGGQTFYNSHYSRKELEGLADKLRGRRDRVHTLYVFFSNDEQGFAVYNAQTFRMLLLERRMV